MFKPRFMQSAVPRDLEMIRRGLYPVSFQEHTQLVCRALPSAGVWQGCVSPIFDLYVSTLKTWSTTKLHILELALRHSLGLCIESMWYMFFVGKLLIGSCEDSHLWCCCVCRAHPTIHWRG